MEWIDANIELPTENGKYVIETRTMAGSINRFQTSFTYKANEKGENRGTFNFSNQVLLRWLKEY